MKTTILTALVSVFTAGLVLVTLALTGAGSGAPWRSTSALDDGGGPWWGPTEGGAAATALRKGLRCSRRPSAYRRALEWSRHRDDPGSWAAEVLGFVDGVLRAPERAAAPGPVPVRWEDGGAAPLVEQGFVRLDGHVVAGERAPVPTYLFLPEVPADAPFAPRGAVVVIHGHDRGRAQVVGYADKYQKAMATRLAAQGYVVLAADNVSFGKHDPLGDGKGKHQKDWRSYLRDDRANGLISYNLTDLTHAITLLTELRMRPDEKLGRYRLLREGEEGGQRATKAIGVTGLSYGAEISAYLMLDPRPVGYIVASGLIDTCDVKANRHHECQLVRPFEGVIALWDLIIAAAVAERPAYGGPPQRPWIQVQQGSKDIILRGWGKRGLVDLRRAARDWKLDRLEVVEWKDAGHEYLVEPALDFWKKVFSAL